MKRPEGKPKDRCVNRTKELVWAGTRMDRHGMPPSGSHVLDYRSGENPKEV